jgi:hypothetical protein
MTATRIFWVGLNVIAVGALLLVLTLRASADAWNVVASCQNGQVSGSVSSDPGSHIISVFVTYHIPGNDEWIPAPGASQTLNVQGTGPHNYGPLNISSVPANANSIRVEIDVTGHPTQEKSQSFKPCQADPTQTPSPTASPTTPVQTPTSTSAVPTNTPVPSTNTPIPSTATQIPATATAVTLAPTATTVTSIGGVVATPTAPAPQTTQIRGIPSAGDGGLLAQHRTSFTVLGVALVIAGVALIAGRGVVDARRI